MDTHILNQNGLEHKAKTLKKRKEIRHFFDQEVELSNTPVFLPEGWEMPLLGIYIIFLPYIAGMFFLFSIAEMDYYVFSSLNDNLFFIMSWLVGYEIIAASALLLIAKNAIFFHLKNN